MPSDFDFPSADSSSNPYAASATPISSAPVTAIPVAPSFPVYCTVMFIVSLVFCVIRAILVPFSVMGLEVIPADHPLQATLPFEIVGHAGMALFGIAGNGLMLARRAWAVWLGYALVFFVLFSIAVGVMQALVLVEAAPAGVNAGASGMVGAIIMLMIRLGLLGCYVVALVKFSAWTRQQPAQETGTF